MKSIIAIGALLVAATSHASSQVVAPVATGPEESPRSEFRIGFSAMSALRVSSLDGNISPNATTMLTGGELFAKTQGIGLYARTLSGTFATTAGTGISGAFKMQEARLVIGGGVLSVEAGPLNRTTSTLDADTEHLMWRGGARSFWEIGSSGVQVTLDAGARFANAPHGNDTTFQFLGFDAQATVLYQAPRGLPLYVFAGWHYERFDDLWSNLTRTEELSGPVFGVGFRIASKIVLR